MAFDIIHSGTMAGKLKGVIPATTPRGLGDGVDVDAGRYLFGVGALEQVGDPAGELQVFEAAGHLALSVGENFAVLRGNDGGHFLAVGVEQFPHAKEDLGAPGKPRRPPGREGAAGGLHGLVHLGRAGEIDLGDRLPEGGVVDGTGPARGARHHPPVDPVTDPLHGSSLFLLLGGRPHWTLLAGERRPAVGASSRP
jgi:hypothetical protein